MKISKGILILIVAIYSQVYSQDSITLINLYKALEINNPITKIPIGIDSVYQLKQKNLTTNYLPKLDFNAQATWQSDVTKLEIDLPIPGFSVPSPDKDQYKLTLDVSQLIWDGGATKSKSLLERVNNEIEKNKVDIEIYSYKEKLTTLYFSVLMLDITHNQLNLMAKELERRIIEIESGVNAGYVLESTLDALKAEKLKLLQNIDAILPQRNSLLSSITSITGVELKETAKLILPNPNDLNDYSCLRPDFENFSYQKDLLNASSSLVSRKRYPLLAGFAQAGYGKPGLSMLSNSWDTYYLLGAKLSWNIWDWNVVNKEKQQLKIQGSIVDYRKQLFTDSYNSQIKSSLLEIEKLRNQLAKDQEIVSLLHQVTEKSGSLLKNGTITSAVYIADFNAESRAQLEMELRIIKLSFEKVKLYNLTGNRLN